ncbi:T9SS type A sorting domain-containing protein [Formosa sp. S-31]|uniref:T9SS type A sorting domain-containing protein n=1 Tax=Formosa sp. S-31 TaxID=2790949 RepID=UPI003EB985E7
MKKNYLLTFISFSLFFILTCTTQAQSLDKNLNPSQEELYIYPNPVSNGKIYIVTKLNLTKEIEIFNVLGKSIYRTTLFGKELNVSKLTSGIYIIKIKEDNFSYTRKLVVQ